MTNFRKILVANRGEIAVRILKTLKRSGIGTVVVHTSDESDSLAVKMADEAYLLNGNSITETFLNIQQILEIAVRAEVDAIHPGYGFLSENFEFAKACEDAGIKFIGPSADSIQLMGNKIKAREFAILNGLPVLKSLYGTIDYLAEKTSLEFNFPLLVKPAGGGGGKGMRIVRDKESLKEELISSAREAQNYFGNDELYIEEYIENPKHIEIQILGDGHGNAVHLFERECSIQRRFQKIIEEAPSPTLTHEERQTLCFYALQLAKAAKYRNAGTIEFLLDEKRNIFFLEMNTRIQVEHPVTESITGIDIVAEQVWISENNSLRIKQENIVINGHAIELRINAEDPASGFLPSAGKILSYNEPAESGLRFDKGFDSEVNISSSYDPLIVKMIAHSSTRRAVVKLLQTALTQFKILGISTNMDYLSGILRHSEFQSGKYTTNFILEHSVDLVNSINAQKNEVPWEIVAAAWLHARKSSVKSFENPDPWKETNFWRSFPNYVFQFRGENYSFLAGISEDSISIRTSSMEKVITIGSTSRTSILTLEGKKFECYLAIGQQGELFADINGNKIHLLPAFLASKKSTEIDEKIAKTDQNEVIRAPLHGKIVNLKVSERKEVRKGEVLLILESMKMENNICATRSGVVQNFYVKRGQQVEKDTPLLLLGPIGTGQSILNEA